MEWVCLRGTPYRIFKANTAWTAKDGGDGYQGVDVKRRWDDWHTERPERAMVRLRIDFLPIGCQPFSVVVFFLLVIDQLDKADAPHPGGVHTSPWRAMPRLTLRRPRGVYLPSLPDYHTRARACTAPPRPYTLPETEPAGAGVRTLRMTQEFAAEGRLARTSCGLLHPPYHEPLRLHLR
jgi:hypothetical protein